MTPTAKRRLGRGLGALLPATSDSTTAPAGLLHVAVDRIRPNPQQPRTHIDSEALRELAQSIQAHGVLQPVIGTAAEDGTYQLIAGERRWRAARLAGMETIPVVVKEAVSQSGLEIALVENIQREDLNALEEALAFRQLLDEHGLTQETLAKRVGKSRVAITNTLRLLQLPTAVQQAVSDGEVSEGHARAILAASSEKAQLALLGQILAEGLSVREAEALARVEPDSAPIEVDGQGLAPARRPRREDPDILRLEDAFRQALGTRVQLKRGRHGGRLVIHFFSEEELEGLYQAIVERSAS